MSVPLIPVPIGKEANVQSRLALRGTFFFEENNNFHMADVILTVINHFHPFVLTVNGRKRVIASAVTRTFVVVRILCWEAK